MSECPNQERLLPNTKRSRDDGILTGHQVLDLKSGFWQMKMSEESHQYAAFMVGSMGMYEFFRMPYGLCNAPATFQHIMQNCLGELNLQFTLIYLDDVIVYSRTQEDHLTHHQAVLDRFAHHGLKLKPSKYHLLRTRNFRHRHATWPGRDREDRQHGTPPTTVTGIRKFIGAIGYFQHFIKNFSCIAKPLDNLTSCENRKLKNHPITLTPTALEAFETLKKKCMTVPVLAFADLEKPFILETDTSGIGLGIAGISTGTRRWQVAPRHLHQQSTVWKWEELPLIQDGVSCLKMGYHQAIPRIPVIQTFHGVDG